MQLPRVVKSREIEVADIVMWVNDNLPKIRGHAKKYYSYSPYEHDDFIQTAYEAALLAANDTSHEYEQSFWFHFKKACLNMTYTKGDKTVLCFHEEYREYRDEDLPPTPVSQEAEQLSEAHLCNVELTLDNELTESTISHALSLMTKKEREVWELLLQGKSLRETAKILNKSKPAVIKLKESGKKRARIFPPVN